MAPEIMKMGGDKYDYKVDIFSMGVIFYQILHKIHPYKVTAA